MEKDKEFIEIEGRVYDVSSVNKDDYVALSGKKYWKNSPEVVQVHTEKGLRYYRKTSRLVSRGFMGEYILKADEKINANGFVLSPFHPEVKSYTDSSGNTAYDYIYFFVKVGDKYIHHTSPDLVVSKVSGKHMLKSDAVKLDAELYGEDAFVDASDSINLDGKIVYINDTMEIVTPTGTTKTVSNKLHTVGVWNGGINGGGKSIDTYFRLDKALAKDIKKFKKSARNGLLYVDGLDLDSKIEEFENRVYRELSALKKNQLRSEYSNDENVVEVIYPYSSSLSGGKIYLKSNKKSLSSFKNLTGNLGYTFGVETETATGLIPLTKCHDLGLSIVGDRTIMGPEYVSSVLHGNNGIEKLKEIYSAVRENCYVDDYCSTHIHVGGIKGDPRIDTPIFNRRFSALAIMLGIQIEKELFQMIPKSRHPNNRHCKSIQEFSKYKIKDARKMVARYVFNSEDFDTDANCKAKLGKWTNSRYKWLNLVNCNSDNSSRSSYENTEGFSTVEFRIWPATTDFNKVYNWSLISMAFVWFVENRQSRILQGNVTLMDVIKAAFRRSPKILDQVSSFISSQTILYNRVDPYKEPFNSYEYRGDVSSRFELEISRQLSQITREEGATASSTGPAEYIWPTPSRARARLQEVRDDNPF